MFRTALILSLPLLLFGQGAFRPGFPGRGGARMAQRERILARIHEMRTRRIQQDLGIPEPKAREIADRWTTFDLDGIERRRTMRSIRDQMNGILRGPGTEEEKNSRVRPLVDHLSSLRNQQQQARQAFEENLRQILTPAQQARFMILVGELERTIPEAIEESRRRR